MPVITLYIHRLKALLGGGLQKREIVDRLPYLGLDIEGEEEDHVRVEYNPNRPDLSTDYGVARALKGLLGVEVGLPDYPVAPGSIEVKVDPRVQGVRPFIVCLVAEGLTLDDETIRQIISMQEDLHNGIGRRRRKISIGIHNLDAIKPPVFYSVKDPAFRFLPLNSKKLMSLREVLEELDVGKGYGHIISGSENYPILTDSADEVLSFPPVINGDLTRVTSETRNLLVDITAIDFKVALDALSIISAALHDAGGRLESVKIGNPDGTTIISTPDLQPYERDVNWKWANRILGLRLSGEEALRCLERCRMGSRVEGDRIACLVPRYRADILHEVDMVEEIALGYGIENFRPSMPRSKSAGRFDARATLLSRMRDALIALGLIEAMNLVLIGATEVEVEHSKGDPLKVEASKSGEHEILRRSLAPSLLGTLARNIHEEYPQRIFELGRVFRPDPRLGTGVREEYHLACAFAHSGSNYTEARSYLETFLARALGLKCTTSTARSPILTQGRAAAVKVGSSAIGRVGEVHPSILEKMQIKVPVSLFEINLEPLLRRLMRGS